MEYKFDSNIFEDLFSSIHENQKSYVDIIETERLILKKEKTPDFISTIYSILLRKNGEKIGEVNLIYDGEIWYKIDKSFRNNGYATEAVSKLIEITKRKDFFLSIKFMNFASRKVAKKLGFKLKKITGRSMIFEKE